MIKRTKYLAATGLAAGLTLSAVAQVNYQWSAGGDKATWSQGANWTQGVAPLNDGTTYQIDLAANAGTNTTPINVAATDVVKLSDSMFGPMTSETLNISGSVSCGWGMFVWGNNGVPAATVNVKPGGSLYCKDTLALGTAWWFSPGANTVINVYSNAFVGVAWFQDGGKLNVYNGGTVCVTNGWNTGGATTPVFTGGQDSDATRAINIVKGAQLILPGDSTAEVNDWLARGILQNYGSPAAAANIVIDLANTNWPGQTVVTTTATAPSVLEAVYIQVPRTNLSVGGLEQAQVYADYTTVSNVNVTLSATNLIYKSSNTNVATVATNGLVRATGVGSATLKAIIGTLTNSVLVTVTSYTNTASLIHRYSFNDATDSGTVADSVPGNSPDWDGTLYSGASLDGSNLILDGVSGYVQFPAGILTNMDAVSVETWVSFGTIPNWAVLFTFGDTTGNGFDYLSCQPHTGGATAQTGIKNASTEQNPWFTPVLDNYTNLHLVAVFHPEAGYCSIYTNGVLAAINSSITITMADAMASGDPYNYIGHSLWSADPYLATTMSEFRIYSGPLSAAQIRADAALGANQVIGTSTNVSLKATVSGSNLMIKWPTTSALVTLLSSPVLGTGAVWTEVTTLPTVVSGNYQVALTKSAAARFYRLKQ